jgi:hypothetical protein
MSEADTVRAALARFMSSSRPSEIRDTVRDTPELLDPAVTDFLAEGARRARQAGHVENANKFEFWLGHLRRFEEYGLEAGYLEMGIEWVANAASGDPLGVLDLFPDLRERRGQEYLERRISECSARGDNAAIQRYSLVSMLTRLPPEDLEIRRLP